MTKRAQKKVWRRVYWHLKSKDLPYVRKLSTREYEAALQWAEQHLEEPALVAG